MYIRCARVRVKSGKLSELRKRARTAGIKESLGRVPGLLLYYVVDTGRNEWGIVAAFSNLRAAESWAKHCKKILAPQEVETLLRDKNRKRHLFGGNVKFGWTRSSHP